MSRLDPSISLGFQSPKFKNVAEIYSEGMQLRDLANQEKLRGQQMQVNEENLKSARLERESLERDAAADKLLNDAMAKARKLDEDGSYSIDHDTVEAALTRAGYGEKALAYRQKRREVEKADLDAIQSQLQTMSARNARLGSLAQSVLNADKSLRPLLWEAALQQAQMEKIISPEQLANLPEEYDEKTEAMLQQFYDSSRQDPAAALLTRIKEKRDAALAQTQQAGEEAQTLSRQLVSEAQLLGAAKTPEEWASALAQLPEARRKALPAEFSEEARVAAVLRGMDPAQVKALDEAGNEIELAQRAARGDKNAKAAMDLLQKYDIDTAVATERAKMSLTGDVGGAASLTAQAIGVPEGQRNEEVLADIAPGMANIVRQLVDGKIPFPSSFALRTPYWNKILELASLYEPGFSATLYKQRADTIKDFTSGQAARNVTSLNTVAGHLDTLNKAAAALDNSKFRAYNSLANMLATGTGDPRVRRFEVARNAVADELERVFRGSGGSLQGIEEWKKTVNAADSPEQLQQAIKQATELIGSRIEALRDQWKKGMVKEEDRQFLTGKSRDIFKNLGMDVDAIDPPVMPREGRSVTITGNMIKVKLPSGEEGEIPESQWNNFLRDNPGATRQ